ncbi:MAG TPA: hypothetical protein VGE38_07070 [Nocardioides sp.]|uniref:hypothetical protein n=1 Tax=Nocardioides sp. TaxID=35761 RepID=UPI002ED850C7
MSDLTQFRDHCKRMGGPITQRNIHLSREDRAVFRALAREVDRYLERPDDTAQPDDTDDLLTHLDTQENR